MLTRSTSVALGLVCAVLAGCDQSADVLDIVRARAGEQHYRVDFKERVVGHYRSETRLEDDRIILETELHAVLPDGDPLEIAETMTFAAGAERELTTARWERRSHRGTVSVDLERADTGFRASLHRNGRLLERVLDWRYTLADHFAVERWLRDEHPRVGAAFTGTQIDFDRMRLATTHWRLLDRTAGESATLSLAAGASGESLFQLDPDLVPRALSLAGVFTLTRVEPGSEPPLPGPLTHSHLAMVPLTQAIDDPAGLQRLRLRINEVAAEALAGSFDVVRRVDGWEADLRHREPDVASAVAVTRASGPDTEVPADHPRFLRLARRAVGDVRDDVSRVERLTRFVHRYLDYRTEGPPASLLDTLEARSGDCTDFADLLTTLARAQGLPARTVVGLAYAEAEGPGFYLHAWTEIVVDGRWHAVDPTFGRTRIGPTHIPFPESGSGFLRAYAAIPEMRFEVVEVGY